MSFTGERPMRSGSNSLPCRLSCDVLAVVLLYHCLIQAGKEVCSFTKGHGGDMVLCCAGVSQAFCRMRLGYRDLWESYMV